MSYKGRIAALGLGSAVALVGSFEGLRHVAYLDPVGIPTACYGHTAGVELGQTYTTAQCEELLGEEFWGAVMTVHRCVPVPLAPHELGASAPGWCAIPAPARRHGCSMPATWPGPATSSPGGTRLG